MLEANELEVQRNDRFLPNSDVQLPLFFIADGGFAIKNYLMTPYRQSRFMTIAQKIFNIRLSHARTLIEQAFGMLCKRWSIFQTPLDFNLQTTEMMIAAAVCLHNYIINSHLNEIDESDGDDEDDNDDSDDSATDDDDDGEDMNRYDNNNIDNLLTTDEDSAYSEHGDDYVADENNVVVDIDVGMNNADGNNFLIDDNVHDNLEGRDVRERLSDYFNSRNGYVLWQWRKL